MADSAVAVANMALTELGENPIQSFDEMTPAAVLAKSSYDDTRDACFLRYAWKWAIQRIELAKVPGIGPPQPNLIPMPADALGTGPQGVYFGPHDRLPQSSGWVTRDKTIYSSRDRIWIDYLRRSPEVEWPTTFTLYVVWELQSVWAPALSDDLQKATYAKRMAEEYFDRAADADGRTRETQFANAYPFHIARFGGSTLPGRY